MTPELETYYTNYFELFNQEGWKQLIQELTTNAVALNNVEQVKDEADLMFKKGQLNLVAQLLNFEALIQNGFEQAKEEAEDA